MATKNLLASRSVYNAYYGDFRGVDFSSDHTQVHRQRLAYAVNMFKDYQSGQGQALETIAGFRRRVVLPGAPVVYGIHHFRHRVDGEMKTKVLVHAGDRLYSWYNYPHSICVETEKSIKLEEKHLAPEEGGQRTFKITLDGNVAAVRSITKPGGHHILAGLYAFDTSSRVLTVQGSDLNVGDALHVSFIEGELSEDDALFTRMNPRRSTSFVFNNRLYLIDGKNYLVYDGSTVSHVSDAAYIPTTYTTIVPSGENSDAGEEYEQRNILQPKFKHTFIADGESTEFYMNENELDGVSEVKVYGEVVTNYDVDTANGKITLKEAPQKPKDAGYPKGYAGIEITAEKAFKSVSGVTGECDDIKELIVNCTIATTFDDRVFLSGNPNYPNHIFYSGRSNITGHIDPSYFPVGNKVLDGVGTAPITGMLAVADTLLVLKSDTQQDGSVYFHAPYTTGDDLHPKEYSPTRGLAGIGCLGACINFLDDPVFISRLGVEAIGQLSVRYERAVEHRSSLIDAKLVNLDLSGAVLEEWNGYLIVLVDGKIFMADSRQKYAHEIGVPQYEWYYVEGVGVYDGQYPEYRYATRTSLNLDAAAVHYCAKCKKGAAECTCGNNDHLEEVPLVLAEYVYNADSDETYNLIGEVANPPDANGESTAEIFSELVSFKSDDTDYEARVYFTIHDVRDGLTGDHVRYEALLCDSRGNKTGGVFNKATVPKTMDDNLFFGTENGVVCSFNFDMRNEQGEIAPKYYNFDERTIFCGCATKMDCCDVPHLTKNTVKKSTVIKTKSLQSSAAKVKVRTNKKTYEQIARINGTMFSFDNMDFSDFSFVTTEQSLFSVKEKEKKWVEKQYFLYSDEYMKPFALYYLSFRYTIAGRYKPI